jgi:biotin carboxylase
VHVVFVAPFLMDTTLRFVKGATALPGVRVSLISQEPALAVPADIRDGLAAHRQVENALDAGQLAEAIEGLAPHLGRPHRILGALEQLQVPLAEVREKLGVYGMSVEAAHNFRDKSRMKNVFRNAGVPCAHHALIHNSEEAAAFVGRVGFPIVVKPPAGAGAKNTFRLENAEQLREYLVTYRPRPEDPTLFEQFLRGREHSFDSICIRGELVWYSVSKYYPTPLEVVENPWIQWCVVLPREVDGPEYADIRTAARGALRAMGVGTALTHMEWFRRDDGGVAISEVAARPPGAQFVTLISYAHDLDFYRAWPRLLATDSFDPPERLYACGAAFLRGQGKGRVVRINGLPEAQEKIGDLVVEAKLPRIGQTSSTGYEGDGYVILRHPDTAVVERALAEVVRTIKVELG